jgi:murein DD-endopeptidase MepM/ murein hydrolase activator NlpD
MSWFNFENLKKTSIYITPNFPSLTTKRYKIKLFSLVISLLIAIFTISILTAVILTFTPAKSILLFLENEKLAEHAIEIEQLEDKIILLTKELNQISEINKRLKFAITLASTDSLDSTANIYDSLRQFNDSRQNFEGNIYSVFTKLFQNSETLIENEKPLFFSPSKGIVIKKFSPDENHIGVDYGVKKGTAVYASARGFVISAEYTLENGYSVTILHENSFITKYKHLSELFVEEREIVTEGDVIALSGNSGLNTTGPHLHFEIWKKNKAINPLTVLVE